ncbi:hypothetical protein J2S37_000151 [Corynebacterium felinum]|uniref:Secreted protein n=1 Tax=Corynebacterium felinum TaxID=131318 RepID=A0ABU2B4T6_9CORY|nr:hypothetical protein [Corynebacterium felinum]
MCVAGVLGSASTSLKRIDADFLFLQLIAQLPVCLCRHGAQVMRVREDEAVKKWFLVFCSLR